MVAPCFYSYSKSVILFYRSIEMDEDVVYNSSTLSTIIIKSTFLSQNGRKTLNMFATIKVYF